MATERCGFHRQNGAHLELTSLIGANLNQVTASNAKMHNVFLEQANLYRATLNNDDLSDTQSFDVNLVFATDLLGSNLLGTALAQNTFCHTQMPDGSTNNTNCPSAP
ncbi:MAG: pentapeptide repeat-containing protein [Solirubrobacteraceae bacterium]